MSSLSNEIILLGIIGSIFYWELTDISPGGIVVPTYFMLYLHNPKKILITVLISIVTLLIVGLISNFTIIYGKRKFSMMIIVASIVSYVFMYLFQHYTGYPSANLIIGYLIPAILANEMAKQGIAITLSSLFILVFILKFIAILMGSV